MRILGIDPALRTSGWGLIDYDGREARYLDAGIWVSEGQSKEHRLASIGAFMSELTAKVCAHELAIEDIFVAHNSATTLKLGEARGVMMAIALQAGLRIVSYAPRLVKKSVTGDGAADKRQVAFMVAQILRQEQDSQREDAWDALAVALCHAYHLEEVRA